LAAERFSATPPGLYGEEKPQGLAAKFVEYILQRAKEDMKRLGGRGGGKARGSLTLGALRKPRWTA
jgi:hypothetical protein